MPSPVKLEQLVCKCGRNKARDASGEWRCRPCEAVRTAARRARRESCGYKPGRKLIEQSRCAQCGHTKVRVGFDKKWRCVPCMALRQAEHKHERRAAAMAKHKKIIVGNHPRVEATYAERAPEFERRMAEIRLEHIRELGAKLIDPRQDERRKWAELAREARCK